MITLMSAFPRSIIRRCEQTLLDAEQFPDQLMQDAASKVAEVAEAMLLGPTPFVGPDLFDEDAEMDDPAPLAGYSVLLVVGSGGNGGDALYAGRDLAARGAEVTALILTKAQKRALDAFPGRIVNRIDAVDPRDFDLLVDGVAGLGSTRPLAGGLLTCSPGRSVCPSCPSTSPVASTPTPAPSTPRGWPCSPTSPSPSAPCATRTLLPPSAAR